jgi:Na+/proline symporter
MSNAPSITFEAVQLSDRSGYFVRAIRIKTESAITLMQLVSKTCRSNIVHLLLSIGIGAGEFCYANAISIFGGHKLSRAELIDGRD